MNKKVYTFGLVAISLLIPISIYFYDHESITYPKPIDPVGTPRLLDMEVLRNDPTAPAWIKDAESCRMIGNRVFCKVNDE